MAYFYGTLAVLGWIWTLAIVLAAVIWKIARRASGPGFGVVQSNEHQL